MQTFRRSLEMLSASGRCYLDSGLSSVADPSGFLYYADQPGPIYDHAQKILSYLSVLDFQVTETTTDGSEVGTLTVFLAEDQETDARIAVPTWKARIRYFKPAPQG